MTNVINNKNLYSKLLQKNLKIEQKIKANEIPTVETTAEPPETVVNTEPPSVKQEEIIAEEKKPIKRNDAKDYKIKLLCNVKHFSEIQAYDRSAKNF